MNYVLEKIIEKIESGRGEPDFLDILFGAEKKAVIDGTTELVIFGAGALGKELYTTLLHHGVSAVCFCDNNSEKTSKSYCGLPIISTAELNSEHENSIIILAVQRHIDTITAQLTGSGFGANQLFCTRDNPDTDFIFMYSMVGSQTLLAGFKNDVPKTIIEFLQEQEQDIQNVYEILADDKSKELYIFKLALLASDESFYLFKQFITLFSEPFKEFGPLAYDGTPEDYYYFNNDVLTLSQDEIFVDVGAFDGDTIETFTQAANKQGIEYKHIYAIEPDPPCYQDLIKNTSHYGNISYHQVAFGAKEGKVQFLTSNTEDKFKVGIKHINGNISVDVMRLDDFLKGKDVTFIKMDPGANVIPDILLGSTEVISKNKPKLALGVYHSIKAIFEIPLMVNNICPEYKIYLRHNTYHLCDTDLFAYI